MNPEEIQAQYQAEVQAADAVYEASIAATREAFVAAETAARAVREETCATAREACTNAKVEYWRQQRLASAE